MGFEIDGVMYCDLCGQVRTECEKQSRICGTCKNYNSMAAHPEKYPPFIEKPLGVTDEEFLGMSYFDYIKKNKLGPYSI